MSEFKEVRREYLREVLKTGEELPAIFQGHTVPVERFLRWYSRFSSPGKVPEFQWPPRTVNHFKIGADPEFALCTDKGGRVHASNCGLQTGLAFGSDLNGRLAELRLAPSKSALYLTASALATLRWMSVANESLLPFMWRGGAHYEGDGLGGHVHFGRKQLKLRSREVNALDGLEMLLCNINFWSRGELEKRRAATPYGKAGDIRLQKHGYEYRTFASWIQSPALTFLVLTLAKLAVHDPELVSYVLLKKGRLTKPIEWLSTFLGYYRGRDDDARLAQITLHKRFPIHQDIRRGWGILALPPVKELPRVYPQVIQPTDSEVKEVFAHLLLDAPLEMRLSQPTWTPTTVPEGYNPVVSYLQTPGREGLGEIVWDLVTHKTYKIYVDNAESRHLVCYPPLEFPVGAFRRFVKEQIPWVKCIHGGIWREDGFRFSLAPELRTPQMTGMVRKLLLSGFFPIWRTSTVTPESFELWREKFATQQVKGEGQLLYDSRKEVK